MARNSRQTFAKIPARMEQMIPAWLVPRIKRGWKWLKDPRRPLTWGDLITTLTTLPSTYGGRFVMLGIAVLLLVPLALWYAQPYLGEKDTITYPHAGLI